MIVNSNLIDAAHSLLYFLKRYWKFIIKRIHC